MLANYLSSELLLLCRFLAFASNLKSNTQLRSSLHVHFCIYYNDLPLVILAG